MGSPQLENGYTKIANETMSELAKIRIPGQARQVLDFILRKTYGWNKKEDSISLSQFVEGTGLTKVSVCKSINKLIEMNLVTKKGNAQSLFTKKGNDNVATYCLQKRYKLWIPLKKKCTLPKKETYVTKKGNLTLPILVPTKETITKENITKEKSNGFVPYSKIQELFNNKLEDLPTIQIMTDGRKANLKSRWNTSEKTKTLEWWGAFFDQILESDFLMGRSPPRKGGKPFRATFDWVINKSNFVKIVEGNYNK